MATSRVKVDVLIFGGGIAGLWTLAHLRGLGYSCLLIESRALGTGQTIASQGIIHGGVKYALTGAASAASRAIAEMPELWRASLEGRGTVSLSIARVLSPRQHLWTTTGIGSRLVGVAASRAIRTPVERAVGEDRPEWLRGAPRGVDVYTVAEPVLDPASVVGALAAQARECLLRYDDVRFVADGDRRIAVLRHCGDEVSVRAERVVLTAGAGNAELADRSGFGGSAAGTRMSMQLRPLHMVMARGRLPAAFGHCIGGGLSDKPRATITTQTDPGGRTVWYIGGLIAEDGVSRGASEQIAAAQAELGACVPWVDLSATEWATLRVDRAEGRRADGSRPDDPVILQDRGVVCVWPTKLAFAPLVARRVAEAFAAEGVEPSGDLSDDAMADLEGWPRPGIAPLPWNDPEVRWS
ncbi:MAG: FAD-dependent oxidoreductase [Phycisphaerales bacterium]